MTEVKVLTEQESLSLALQTNELLPSACDLTPIQKNLLEMEFTHPCRWQDGIVRPMTFFVAEYLRSCGVADQNIKAGLLVYTAMNSVRLGYPQSIILLAEDDGSASQLLHACKMIAPSKSLREVQELKAEQFYSSQVFYRGKVLICSDLSGVTKAMPDLLNLLTMGQTTRQGDSSSKFRTGTRTFTARYPIAFIGIEDPATRKTLMGHPSIIRIPIVGDFDSPCLRGVVNCNQPQERKEDETGTIATMFERLSKRNVSIPFQEQILTCLILQRPENFRDKANTIMNIIRLSTIMGDPPPFSMRELFKMLNGIDEGSLIASPNVRGPGEISAGKVDYFLASLLLDDVLTTGSKSFTRMETRVFEAVKSINFGKAGMAMMSQNSSKEKLTMLPRIPEWWAYMYDIMGTLNKSAAVFISAPEIETVLGKLKTMKVMGEKRGESSKGEGYFILVPAIDSFLRMPEPKQINDPAFLGPPIRVMNPITGVEEEI